MFGVASFAQSPFASLAGAAFAESVTEAFSVADASAQLYAFTFSQTEDSTLSDIDITGAGLFVATLNEDVGLAETVVGGFFSLFFITEDVASASVEEIAAQFSSALTEDTVLVDDTAQTFFAFLASRTEAIDAVADASTQQYAFLQSLTEPLTSDDIRAIAAQFAQSVTENTTLNDVRVIAAQFAAVVSEGATVDDIRILIQIFVDSITENFSPADARTIIAGFAQSVAENLNPNDVRAVAAAFQAAISENAVLADSFGVGGWVKIITTQNPNWQNINTE